MKLLLLSSIMGASTAFAPSATASANTALRMSTPEPDSEPDVLYSVLSEVPGEPEALPTTSFSPNSPSAAAVASINGWVPDDSKPCYGLPGALAPMGYFDPIGFCRYGNTLNDVKRYREAEVQHGRVAMIAFVGYLAGEAVSGPFHITGPANDQLQQMPLPAFVLLTVGIAAAELKRATIGWVEPDLGRWTKTLFTLRDNYYPGDVSYLVSLMLSKPTCLAFSHTSIHTFYSQLGFDPLGLKPADGKEFATMQTKELQHGRLAMLGVAGLCAQELVNHKTVMATFDFYQTFYSGGNPY